MSTSCNESKRLWSLGMRSVKRNGNQCQTCSYTSLPKEFFTELIRLEADFHMKNYTLETLNELTQYYARAVEHYDSFKDEITSYFIFKIQDILATKKSLIMLKKETQKTLDKKENKTSNVEEPKQKKPLFEIQQNPSLEGNSESDEDNGKVKKFTSKRTNSNRKKSPGATMAQLRNQKKRFVNLFYKIEDQLVNEKENMTETVNVYHSSKQKNDDLVKNDINKQKERIQKKLEQKKYESFMSQTMNSNSFQLSSRNQHAYSDILERKEQSDRTLELMLKELDESDDDDGRGIDTKREGSLNNLTNKSYSDGGGMKKPSKIENQITIGAGKSGFFQINDEKFKHQLLKNSTIEREPSNSEI